MDFLGVDAMELTFETVSSNVTTTMCLEICILNDNILEAREEFRLLLNIETGENAVITNSVVDVAITDNSGEL